MKILQYIYTIYAALILILMFVIAVPFYFIISLLTKGTTTQKWILRYNRWIISFWTFATGIKINVFGEDKIDDSQAYVVAPNHTSMMDAVLAVKAVTKITFLPLVKIEIKKIPVVGYLFSKGALFVDRSDKESRRKSVESLKEYANNNFSILIFPEGTRNQHAEIPLKPFHSGAFRIAIDLQLPILPVVFVCNYNFIDEQKMLIRPHTLECHFGSPIPTKGLTQDDMKALKEQTHNVLYNMMLEHNPDYASYIGKPKAQIVGYEGVDVQRKSVKKSDPPNS